jgi:hypothetical protein
MPGLNLTPYPLSVKRRGGRRHQETLLGLPLSRPGRGGQGVRAISADCAHALMLTPARAL